MKADPELEPFGRLIEALEPWLDDVVVITGWAHRLYRLDRRAAALKYSPLTTLDSDVAIPPNIEVKGGSIRDRLLAAGFKEECVGEDRPPATHYHLGTRGGFYAEFLTPLIGSEYGRRGERKATRVIVCDSRFARLWKRCPMAKSLRLNVIAEGVETAEQLAN